MAGRLQLVTIVGGGISGLSAAYELHRRGVPFRLFEASDRFGGIVRTDREGKLVIDAGPDGMLARKPAGIALCEELGIANRLVPSIPPRIAFVVRGGQLVPLVPKARLEGSGRELSRSGTSTRNGSSARGPTLPDCSIADFFRQHYPADALDYYAEPALAGIHAGDVERLSVNALFPELVAGTTRDPDPLGEFRSFAAGMRELIDALVAALPASAVRLSTPAPPVADLLVEGPVVVAVPGHKAAALFAPLDARLSELCAGIRYVSSGIVLLAYSRRDVDHPLAGSGFVVPRVERGFRILAASWLSSKWPGRAPADVALMRAFFGGARDPGAMALSDEEIAGVAHDDLARLLNIRGTPSFVRVYRWENGTPQYEVGYSDRLAAIRTHVARHPGLAIAGAGFGAIGIPDGIADGRAAAIRALDG